MDDRKALRAPLDGAHAEIADPLDALDMAMEQAAEADGRSG